MTAPLVLANLQRGNLLRSDLVNMHSEISSWHANPTTPECLERLGRCRRRHRGCQQN